MAEKTLAPVTDAGLQDLKEVFAALNMVSLFLIERFKDGFQIADGVAIGMKIATDREFQTALLLAYEGYSRIVIKDITAQGYAELASLQASYVPLLIESFASADKASVKAK